MQLIFFFRINMGVSHCVHIYRGIHGIISIDILTNLGGTTFNSIIEFY